MAKSKYKRRVVGSFYKSKEKERPPYLKFREDLSLKQGQTLSVESAKYQLENLARAVENGKLSEELAEKVKERINKIPDFVLAELVLIES